MEADRQSGVCYCFGCMLGAVCMTNHTRTADAAAVSTSLYISEYFTIHSGAISMTAFPAHVQEMHKHRNKGFEKEFQVGKLHYNFAYLSNLLPMS